MSISVVQQVEKVQKNSQSLKFIKLSNKIVVKFLQW